MPYTIRKRSGLKPWKIINRDTGRVLGSSRTKAAAQRSVNARNAAEHGAKLNGRGRRR